MTIVNRLFSLYLLPDFSLQAFSSAIEALRLANEVIGSDVYLWRVASDDGHPVHSNCGVVVSADTSLADERILIGKSGPPSVAVVVGGGRPPQRYRALHTWLRECRAQKLGLAGIASGIFAFAQTGLANGRRCAVHWEQFPSFLEVFPSVEAVQTAYEIDGDLYSCSGGEAAFDMFLRIIDRDHEISIAGRVCEKAIASRIREPGERQRIPLQTRFGINNDALLKIVEKMEAAIAEPVPLERLAAFSGLSRRHIERLFLHELGCSPARYYRGLRLERAHLLILNSALPMVDIAIACGFVSASHFSRSYRESYGRTPQQERFAAAERRNASKQQLGRFRPAPLRADLPQVSH
ncbi:GlxA family transcriptional regulator [Phyllobacterium zundukense]|uniref:AraC family transcriptional regulator n=1 Tax=Phyllobacterium zundukense TaxID=1867719 RepID=A0A2N9W1B3_9HYPH|nr:GlxA family transcriptional regulator [Phyllobacterium zundukense]PIO45531.1 AraC family transcriptional regulator [Phyllobacterium zundukense]